MLSNINPKYKLWKLDPKFNLKIISNSFKSSSMIPKIKIKAESLKHDMSIEVLFYIIFKVNNIS